MSHGLGAVCDEFFINSRLFLKLDLAMERETVLHFFDRLRREYPSLKRLRRRDEKSLILEEDNDEDGSRRWVRLDPDSLRFGHVAPDTVDEVRRFGEIVLTQAPYHLSFSELDYDHLEVVFGFDLEYTGNHDHLVAETLLGEHAASSLLFGERASHIIDAQPYFGVALSPECDLQAYVEVKSRTTTYEVRSGHYESQPISIFLTLRKYWGVEHPASLEGAFVQLIDLADEIATDMVVPSFVNPLAAAIASRS